MSTRQSPPSPTTITSWPPDASTLSFKPTSKDVIEASTLGVRTHSVVERFHHIQAITFDAKSWRLVLGIVALIDCAVTLWLFCFRAYFANETQVPKHRRIHLHHASQDTIISPDFTMFIFLRQCTQLFEAYHVQIGVLFSLLWFIDAFLKAQWKRNEKLVELDRLRLLGSPLSDAHYPQGGAWTAYYKTIVLQLLLLPVGFYVFALHFLMGNEQHVKAVLKNGNSTKEMERSYFSIYSTHSLVYSFISFHIMLLRRIFGEEVETRRKSLWRRLILFAIRRPFLFSKRLRIFLSTLRLTKYLGPLMGEIAKFVGNGSDLLKTCRQQLAVRNATRLRKKRWYVMNLAEKRNTAAIRIQCAVRGMHTRRTVKSFLTVLKARKERIARRLQRAVRASIVASRTQHDLMRLELDKLEEEANQAKLRGYNISIEHRRRMYHLQDELEHRAKELLNKHLLLHPSSRFAILWKFMFVLCVLLDIAQQALQPWLQQNGYKDAMPGDEPMTVEHFLELQLIPKPMSEWEQCALRLAANENKKLGLLRRYISSVLRRTQPKAEQRLPFQLKIQPWYCHERYTATHLMWIRVLRFCVLQTALIVGIIRYLDVGVTFFIGEVHPQTGVLMPKSFVKRWIFPGLLLELLANPQMESTSKLVGRLLDGVVQVGPIRIGRWTLVGLYPLATVLKRTVMIQLWRPVVLQQNRECTERAVEMAQWKCISRSRSAHTMASMSHDSELIVTEIRRSRSTHVVAVSTS